MKQPQESDFGITSLLRIEAQKARDLDWTLQKICMAVIAISIFVTGIYLASIHSDKHFGGFHWAVATLVATVIAAPFGGAILGGLISVILGIHSKHSSFDKKENEFRKAQRMYELEQRRQQEEYWWSLSGHEFEFEVASLFRKAGGEVTVTKGSGDGGIDIIVQGQGVKTAVQCKAHRKPVGPSVVRDLYGAMHAGKFDMALLVSLGGVTMAADAFCKENNIQIMTIDHVIALNDRTENNPMNPTR